jgi:hypothetical protein
MEMLRRKDTLCMPHSEGNNTDTHNIEHLLLSNGVILPDSRKMFYGKTFKN